MALIICPECGKENVSDTAVSCPECGYAIKEHFEKIKIEEEKIKKEKELEEKRQAEVRRKKETEGERQKETIERLNNQIEKSSKEIRNAVIGLAISIPLFILFCYINNHGDTGVLIVICGFAIFISGVFFISSIHERNTAVTDLELVKQNMEKYEKNLNERLERIAAVSRAQQIKNATKHPKCPMCGSNNTQRISTINRSTSVLLVGLASSKIGKQYECKNCKHKW